MEIRYFRHGLNLVIAKDIAKALLGQAKISRILLDPRRDQRTMDQRKDRLRLHNALLFIIAKLKKYTTNFLIFITNFLSLMILWPKFYHMVKMCK
jgi:hypothetical protein